jgi:RNA polymerase sigma-70 factor (ECF subfamily)
VNVFSRDDFQTKIRYGNVLFRVNPGIELERVYDDHASALHAFILNLTRSEADTRDLLQEVYVRLARRPTLLAGVTNERPFLVRLAHNLAVDLIRRRSTRERRQDQYASEHLALFAPVDDPDREAFEVELGRALAALPVEQRAVVHLKLWEGMTFEAIAETLEIPANTAASRYRYGLDKLRDLLRPFYDEIKHA